MANKELYNVLVDITLKPYGHTETQESVEVFVEDVANLSTNEEDVAVALGKLHAWYTNFTPWVFAIPTITRESGGFISDFTIDSSGNISLQTSNPNGLEGWDIGYIGNWNTVYTNIIWTDTRHNMRVFDGTPFIMTPFFTPSVAHQSQPEFDIKSYAGVHFAGGAYSNQDKRTTMTDGYPEIQADIVFVKNQSLLLYRVGNDEDGYYQYFKNWKIPLLPDNVSSSDGSLTVSKTNTDFVFFDAASFQEDTPEMIRWHERYPYAITLSHTNNVTAQPTSGMYKFTYDANGHITGSTAVQKSDITALGIPGSNTDTKVTQNITTTSSDYPLLLSYYTTSSTTTTAQSVNRASTLYFNPGYGSLSVNRPAGTHGGYIMTHDSGDNEFNMIGYNGTNFWIGKGQRAASAHIGETYISTGYNSANGTGNPSIFVAVPNDTNTNDSCYPLLHQGNTYFQTSSNAATWEALGITKSGYAFYVFRGDTANKTPPYCAGYYAPGLLFGYGDTKGFISTSYNEAKVSFGGGQRTNSDPATKAPTWYFTLSGTTATTYNLDNFALASDYLPLAGGTMNSGATVTVYTDQAETQGIQYTSTGQRFKIASGVGWARSVIAYKGAFSGDILGAYGMFGASDSFTNNRMSYFYIGKSYNDQWYEFAYGKHTIVDNDLNGWMLRYRYPWTSGSSTGTYEGSFISLYPYDRNGYCLCIGENSGGLTIIGGGEAGQNLRITVTDAEATPYGSAMSYGSESVMIGADSDLYFVSGANSLSSTAHEEGTNLKTFIWSSAGTLRPWNDDMYSIGAVSKRWNYGYFTNISGKLIGTIDSSTTATTQALSAVTNQVATCNFTWKLLNNSGIFYNDNTSATTAVDNPWQCIADATITASGNTYISTTFLIDSAFTSYPGTGIVHFRASIQGAAGSMVAYTIKWLNSDQWVNDSTIVFTYKLVSSTSVTVKIWAKAPKRYEAIHIHPLYEATRAAARTSEFWTYHVNSAGVASIPSDEHVMTSTTKQVLLHESASSTATSLDCTVTDLFKIWQVVYVCIQNLSYGSGSNPMSINFLVPLGYVKSKSNYNTAIGSSNPGYYVGEGYNPSNTGTSHTRMLVQWKDDNTIVFTNGSGNRMGIVRIYGIS